MITMGKICINFFMKKSISEAIFLVVQIITAISLVGLSTQIAIEGRAYLAALKVAGIENTNIFILFVIAGFIGGILLLLINLKPIDEDALKDFLS